MVDYPSNAPIGAAGGSSDPRYSLQPNYAADLRASRATTAAPTAINMIRPMVAAAVKDERQSRLAATPRSFAAYGGDLPANPTRAQTVLASMKSKMDYANEKVGNTGEGWITPAFWGIPMDVKNLRESTNIQDLRDTPGVGATRISDFANILRSGAEARLGDLRFSRSDALPNTRGAYPQYSLGQFWGGR